MTEKKALVYVIEDEADLGQLVRDTLNSYHFEAKHFLSGKSAMDYVQQKQPDICIVDLNLPDIDGMEMVKQMDALGCGVVIISGRDGLSDRVLGLEFGADDYLTKPFEPRELVARVQSLYRRLKKNQPTTQNPTNAKFGNWLYKTQSLCLWHEKLGEETLSRAESDILMALLKHPFQILSRDQLLGDNCSPYDRSIDVRMSRLRKKISQDPQHPDLIKTVYGAGYMLTSEVDWV